MYRLIEWTREGVGHNFPANVSGAVFESVENAQMTADMNGFSSKKLTEEPKSFPHLELEDMNSKIRSSIFFAKKQD